MKAFADLWATLEGQLSEARSAQILARYLQQTSAEDAAWAIYLLCGKKPKKLLSARELVEYFLQTSGTPGWLFWESDDVVGDVNETIALLNDTFMDETASQQNRNENSHPQQNSLAFWMENQLNTLAEVAQSQRPAFLGNCWQKLGYREAFIINRILTGTWKSNLPLKTIAQALSIVSGQEPMTLMHRLKADWLPNKVFYAKLIAEDQPTFQTEQKFSFGEFKPLEESSIESLGAVEDWWLAWQWEGLRVQCIRRADDCFLWSQNGELVTDRFPELHEMAQKLPEGTILEGVIVACSGQAPLPLADLQPRLGGKSVNRKMMESCPVAFVATDLQLLANEDMRNLPAQQRKTRLAQLANDIGFPLVHFPRIEIDQWAHARKLLQEARQHHAEGLSLQRLNSPYPIQNQQADWWSWKVQPHTINAILLYAKMEMAGRSQKQTTEYTFAVWHEDQLVPVARTGIGLPPEEAELLDGWIRANTYERFGPVRSVEPFHVYEIAFDGITPSKRHKCGFVLREPRIINPRPHTPIEEASRLEDLHRLLPVNAQTTAGQTIAAAGR